MFIPLRQPINSAFPYLIFWESGGLNTVPAPTGNEFLAEILLHGTKCWTWISELVSLQETPGAGGADLFACSSQCIYYITDNLQPFSWHCRTLWIVLIHKGNPSHTNVTNSNSCAGISALFQHWGQPSCSLPVLWECRTAEVRASSPSLGPGAAQSAGKTQPQPGHRSQGELLCLELTPRAKSKITMTINPHALSITLHSSSNFSQWEYYRILSLLPISILCNSTVALTNQAQLFTAKHLMWLLHSAASGLSVLSSPKRPKFQSFLCEWHPSPWSPAPLPGKHLLPVWPPGYKGKWGGKKRVIPNRNSDSKRSILYAQLCGLSAASQLNKELNNWEFICILELHKV